MQQCTRSRALSIRSKAQSTQGESAPEPGPPGDLYQVLLHCDLGRRLHNTFTIDTSNTDQSNNVGPTCPPPVSSPTGPTCTESLCMSLTDTVPTAFSLQACAYGFPYFAPNWSATTCAGNWLRKMIEKNRN